MPVDENGETPPMFPVVPGSRRKEQRNEDDDEDDIAASAAEPTTTRRVVRFDDVGAIRDALLRPNDDDDDGSSRNGNETAVPVRHPQPRRLPPPPPPPAARHFTHLLFAMPAPADRTTQEIVDEILRCFLGTAGHNETQVVDDDCRRRRRQQQQKKKRWIGLVSTTGVYGDHDGNWVDEESDCRCFAGASTNATTTTAAGRLLQFETYLKDRATAAAVSADGEVDVRIFRCAGIYGGDRSALHTVYKQQRKRSTGKIGRGSSSNDNTSDDDRNDNDVLTNRIHVDDVASAIVASMVRTAASDNQDDETTERFRIYNLADNFPESRRVVMEYAEQLLLEIENRTDYVAGGVVAVEEEAIGKGGRRTTNAGRSSRRGTERKLVDNRRMREELLPVLRYPTYKEGLRSILNDKSNPWWRPLSERDDRE